MNNIKKDSLVAYYYKEEIRERFMTNLLLNEWVVFNNNLIFI